MWFELDIKETRNSILVELIKEKGDLSAYLNNLDWKCGSCVNIFNKNVNKYWTCLYMFLRICFVILMLTFINHKLNICPIMYWNFDLEGKYK